jgi:hypothetical protein
MGAAIPHLSGCQGQGQFQTPMGRGGGGGGGEFFKVQTCPPIRGNVEKTWKKKIEF